MLYRKDEFLAIVGPCALESEAICREVAECMVKMQKDMPGMNFVFSGSFDKANRSSLTSLRGPGMEEGLRLLSIIKEDYGFPVLTDYHSPTQAAPLAEVCDALQIPAFLSRQTDLLVAGAKTGKTINVKKGQFMSPQEMIYAVQKLEQSGAAEIWQTDRGTFFGYNNLVVDMRSFPVMEKHGHPVIFDATHSAMLPGAANGVSGGDRSVIPALTRAAIGAGAQGLYIEAHPNPDQAISDAQTQLPVAELPKFLESCYRIWDLVRSL